MTRYSIAVLVISFSIQSHATEISVGVGDANRSAVKVENGRLVGSLAKLYQCPFDKSGFTFNLRLLPQARVLLGLQRGDLSLGMPLVKLNHRDDYAVITKPMMDIRFVLYTRKDIKVTSDLSAYNFTVLRSSASIDLVAQHNAQFTEVSSWTQALELARLGRFDGAVIPAVVLKDLAAEDFAGLRQLDFGSLPLSMYVSKQIDNTEEIVQRLNAAIDLCQP
jgi:ABC-type amino acid transport substrate-binding protein